MEPLQSLFDTASARLGGLPSLIVSPDSRVFYGYLGASVLIALGVYLHQMRGKSRSLRGFVRYVVPREVYRHPSFGLDLKLILFNRLIVPVEWLLQGFTLVYATDVAARAWGWLIAGPVWRLSWTSWQLLLLGVALFVVYDLARFVCHVLHHKVAFLWRFHAIHHSAEQLNPFTTYRFHPLELFLESVSILVLVGAAAGLARCLFGGDPIAPFEGVVVWFYFRIFTLLGATLRHSHVWLHWGRVLGHVFISPAQHQIHHSTAARHIDRNYGVCLAVWDWLLGSLYMPRRRESLTFGIEGMMPYRTLAGALLRPFKEAAKGESEQAAPTPPTGPGRRRASAPRPM